MVNLGGRPREHDRDAIAQELIEWAKLPDSLNMCGFCCTREPPLAPSKITDWSRECPKFRVAYDIAKSFIGTRRETKLSKGELHVKAYDLNAATYDFFLKEERRAQLEFENSLKIEEQKAYTEEEEQKANLLINEIKGVRQALNKADTSIKAETKS